MVYNSMHEYAEAIDCFELALEREEKLGRPEVLGGIFNGMGMAYSGARRFEDAEYCFEKAVENEKQRRPVP